jgi:hypothetical protein
MNPSPPSSPPPAARLRRLEWLAALAGLGTALGWLLLHTPPPAPLPEVPRAQLTLREGLLYSKDTAVPFTGIVTEYYEGGGRKSRSVVAQGFLEGLSEGWHANFTLPNCRYRSHLLRCGCKWSISPVPAVIN